MKRLASAVLLSGLVTILTLGLSGCGSSTQPISVVLTPSGTHGMDQTQNVAITAAVAHDPKGAGVTWTVSGGGTLSAQTTTSVTYNAPGSVNSAITATVTATSVTDITKSASLTITVNPLPAITTTSLTVTAGTAYNGTLSESGGTSPYTYAMTAGTLPTGLSLNASTGAITGMPTGPSGNSSITVQITDAAKMSASQTISTTVSAPPLLAVTTKTLPAGVMGTAYNQTLQATGGVPPYTWSSGTLPQGLSLNASTGVISGTPTGTYTGSTAFSVTVTDSYTPTHATGSANLSIAVSAPQLKVTTGSLPGGSIGNAYSQTLQATGGAGAYTWSYTGTLPTGLTLNPATGVISGTVGGTFVGTDSFTVTVTDAETPTPQTANASLSITITVAPLSVTTSGSLPSGVAGSVYAGATLQATGGIQPYTWTVTTGSLPAGLTLNASTGAISGTPTASGTVNFTVTVTDSETPTAKTATANLSITINPAVMVTTTSLPAGVIGTAYNQTLTATGGITPYTWAITTGTLPTGLSLNSGTGVISGTPSGTFTGTTSFTVTVTDSESPTKKTASANLSITITAPTLKVTTTSLPGGSIGAAYNQTLQATGGITPYTWSVTVGTLPTGLTLNAATGVISGTIGGTFVGTDTFTVTVADAETPTPQTANASLSITITVAPLSVTTSGSLPTGVVNSVYPGATLQATGGITPYTWTVTGGNLPAGLSLSSGGVLSGTPTASGTFNFTVTVTDSETPTPKTASANLSITVNAQLTVTTTSLAAGVIGTTYSQTLAASGGITPYTWAVTTGTLPAGLSLNSSTGVISGTPSGNVTGTITFTITVTDSESPTKKTASANLSITITAPTLKITTTSLPGGSIGAAYNQTLQATGGITPYTWSVTVGTLPTGLTLNAATGVISGTIGGTFVGTDTFTVTVSDAETPTPQTANASLSITITVAPLSVTTSGSLPTGVVNSVYPGATLQATGGITPYTWAVTGGTSLPAGLTLNASTGVISGTPTASGTTNFTVTVTDSETPTPKTASANLSITVNPQLTVTTTSLAAGVIGTSYSQTLAAAGGITPYTWAITTGTLPAGLSLNSSTGVISGTPSGNFTGTTSFTVTVTDSESPTKKTASANLSITISAPTLKITTTGLPTGVVNNSYSATVSATGGVTPYTWSLSGNPAWLSINPSTGVLSGTPTATGTFGFTVKVTDSETPTAQTASANLSITVNNSAPLTITTTGLPQGVINTPYQNAVLTATGGVQPYTWSISSGSLPAWATLNAATGAITGTPTATGTTNFTVKVTDSSSPANTATAPLSITINAALVVTTTSIPNGSVGTQYNATVNASGGLQPYSWNILSGSLPPGLSPNNNNNSLNISGTPTTAGSYPFTVQVTDNQGDTASQQFTVVIGTQPQGYTVSGNVSYGGSKTGFVYLQLNSNNCGGCNNNLGTSISEATLTQGGAFTIHGVQPGTYTLQAFMDNLGHGAENASNPTGSVSNINVVNANVSGVAIPLTDPGTVTLSSGPAWQSSSAFSGGAFVTFNTITNNNGIEMPASYTLEWSTSSSFSGTPGSASFPAVGNNNPWIVNGLTNGTAYYFRAQGVAGSSTSSWVESPSAITIGAPTGGNSVSGTVTFSQTATGPLYVGFYNQNTNNIYAEQVGSKSNPPKSPASYSVSVPTGSNYYFFGVLDQNNTGLVGGPGEVSNVNNNNNASVVINGPLTNEDLTLPSSNSIASIRTQAQEQINGGTTINYSIGFEVDGQFKLPVAVEITTESNPGVVIPADIANNAFGNSQADRFSFWTSTNGFTPQVGDTYTLNVTYSDGTSENLTPSVTAVLNDAFVTNLVPQGTGVSVTPNFSWTDPTGASNYTYQFWLCCNQNGTIWQIPSNNSNSNGFPYTITSITWDVDPTGSGDLPNVSSLNGLTNYSWQIQATDVNGNSAQVQVNFETASTPLTLPPAGSVGSVVVGQNFNGAINASGGVGPYTFTVNGSQVPTDGTQVSLGDNLFASNTGGNTLSLSGTPTSIQTVSFTVSVTDSEPITVGPYTYTITVTPAAALSMETTALPGGNNGWAYNTSVKATGGVQPYTWSIISGGLPAGLSPSSNGGSNYYISGTPSGTGTASFTVQVEDSESPPVAVTANLSITITSCTYAALNGNYAFVSNGWDSSGSTLAASAIGSFVANGSGTISSGLIDVSDQANPSGPQSGTFTGTYCVGANNIALISLAYAGGLSGSDTFAAALDASDGNGHLISYDNGNLQVSGLLQKQNTSKAFKTSLIDGNYAFGIIGASQQGSNRLGLAGEFNSNGSGNLSGEADYDNGCQGGCGSGNFGTTNLTASNFTVASSGRGTAGIYLSAPNVTVNFVFYVVSSSEMLMMAIDNSETPPVILAGQVLQQSGTLNEASLNGNSIIELVGLDNSGGSPVPDVQVGLINANGSGKFSVSIDENDGGTFDGGTGSPQTISGDYSVDPSGNGRVTLSNLTGCPGGCGSHNPIFYLVSTNQAFVIDTGGEVSFGTITPQSGSNFNNASLNGNYANGSEPPVILGNGEEVDSLNFNGSGTINVITDKNGGCQGCGSPQLGSQSMPGLEYSVSSNGRVVVSCGPDSGGNCGPSGTQVAIIYLMSDSQGVLMVEQDSNPRLNDFHQ